MYRKFLIFIASLVILSWAVSSSAQTDYTDVLLYHSIRTYNDTRPTQIMMWNPQTDEHTLILDNFVGYYIPHLSGKIAYHVGDEGNRDIYILDIFDSTSEPINITQSPNIDDRILYWSNDGNSLRYMEQNNFTEQKLFVWRDGISQEITSPTIFANIFPYLETWSADEELMAFTTIDSQQNTYLFVWDGSDYIDITPNDLSEPVETFQINWSADNRLVIEAWYRLPESMVDNGSSDLYVWDGQQTIKIPKPTDDEEYISLGWSDDGQLAMRLAEDFNGDIFIWDGVSLDDLGRPDVDTFTNVAPLLTHASTSAIWTPDNRLIFVAENISELLFRDEIYAWDGTVLKNISQNPGLNDLIGAWSWNPDGRWTSHTLHSPEQLVYVHNANNETIFTGAGRAPTWSHDGMLAFCNGTGLMVWDGSEEKVIVIGEGLGVEASWLQGRSIGYSNG